MSAVLTFYPHPTRVLRPDAAPGLLETLPQRLAEFETLGIDAALVLKFDHELAKASAKTFARGSWWKLCEHTRCLWARIFDSVTNRRVT